MHTPQFNPEVSSRPQCRDLKFHFFRRGPSWLAEGFCSGSGPGICGSGPGPPPVWGWAEAGPGLGGSGPGGAGVGSGSVWSRLFVLSGVV